MKNLFIFLNIILFICVVFLFMLHFSHKSPPPEKILSQTPNKPDITVMPVFESKNNSLTSSELDLIVDNDLFSPARGVDPASLQTATTSGKTMKHNQLELTGICKMGDMKGAIIVNTRSRTASASNKKQFYLVGERIADTPYTLKDINPEEETAIISMGTTQFALKMERDDTGSLMRRSKGEADSKALISSTKPTIVQKPVTKTAAPPLPKTFQKTKPISPPKNNSNKKTPEQMKQIREAILKKMINRRKKTSNNKL